MHVESADSCAAPDPLVLTRLNAGYGAVCLAASGEVDLCNADRLHEAIHTALNDPATQQLTLDFADLAYIDSRGVRAVTAGAWLGQHQRIGFTVINAHGEVLRALRILGLDHVLAIRSRRHQLG